MASAAIIHFRRAELEKRIQELVDLLDILDGDPDLEDTGDDEPSIGPALYHKGELVCDVEYDKADDEPSLGWDEGLNQCSGSRLGVLGACDQEADTGRIYGGCGL